METPVERARRGDGPPPEMPQWARSKIRGCQAFARRLWILGNRFDRLPRTLGTSNAKLPASTRSSSYGMWRAAGQLSKRGLLRCYEFSRGRNAAQPSADLGDHRFGVEILSALLCGMARPRNRTSRTTRSNNLVRRAFCATIRNMSSRGKPAFCLMQRLLALRSAMQKPGELCKEGPHRTKLAFWLRTQAHGRRSNAPYS